MVVVVVVILCRVCRQVKKPSNTYCQLALSTTYVYHHNLVACAVYWHFCKHYLLLPLASKSWFSHNPSPVCENSTTKLLWDFHLHSNSHLANNRPDIVLFTFPQKIYFFGISCPGDVNVSSKKEEKTCKYIPLARVFNLMYHMAVEVISIVFGHTAGE